MSLAMLAYGIGGIGSLLSGNQQYNSVKKAARAQVEGANQGIDEQRALYGDISKLLSPYVNAGNNALAKQLDLLGVNGNESQQAAYDALSNSPAFQALQKAGETSILQNASATGGLRGGNTQGALAQFNPGLLAQVVQDQFQNLSGITNLGQNTALNQANTRTNVGNNVTNLIQQRAAAQAGGYLGTAKAYQNALSGVSGAFAGYAGLPQAQAPLPAGTVV